jgi:hypothetical protein
MKHGGIGTAPVRQSRMMTVLVGAQISLSLVLLVGAGLYARSAMATSAIDPGFDVEKLASATVDLKMYRFEEAAGKLFFERAISSARAVPNVASAVIVTALPVRTVGGRTLTSSYVLPQGGSLRSTPYGSMGTSRAISRRLPVFSPRFVSGSLAAETSLSATTRARRRSRS